MEEREKITEGKTKIIWSFADDPNQVNNLVYIESKDNITAGDGLRCDSVEGKGALYTRTTANIFLLLRQRSIPNHFVRLVDEKTFLARRLLMMPIEVVVRRRAAGSFCQRHPGIEPGKVFDKLLIELYLKDDKNHDPLIIWNGGEDRFELFDAHSSVSMDGFRGVLDHDQYVRELGDFKNFCVVPKHPSELTTLKNLVTEAFIVIERAWKAQNYILSDFKIEMGWNQSGALIIGDVITNDEWRLQRRVGETKEEMSKQRYRDLKEVTPETLAEIRRCYEIVADATDNFLK